MEEILLTEVGVVRSRRSLTAQAKNGWDSSGPPFSSFTKTRAEVSGKRELKEDGRWPRIRFLPAGIAVLSLFLPLASNSSSRSADLHRPPDVLPADAPARLPAARTAVASEISGRTAPTVRVAISHRFAEIKKAQPRSGAGLFVVAEPMDSSSPGKDSLSSRKKPLIP